MLVKEFIKYSSVGVATHESLPPHYTISSMSGLCPIHLYIPSTQSNTLSKFIY